MKRWVWGLLGAYMAAIFCAGAASHSSWQRDAYIFAAADFVAAWWFSWCALEVVRNELRAARLKGRIEMRDAFIQVARKHGVEVPR